MIHEDKFATVRVRHFQWRELAYLRAEWLGYAGSWLLVLGAWFVICGVGLDDE
jgi:hypothetical protein